MQPYWGYLNQQLSPTGYASWQDNYPGGYSGVPILPNPPPQDWDRFWSGPTWWEQLGRGIGSFWQQMSAPNPNVLPNASFDWRGGY